jgi:MFS family permease
MFRNPAVAVILVQNLLFGVVYYSQLYYLPLFFQNALQLSPLISAALLLPVPSGQMIFSIASGQFISRFERYGVVIWAGFFIWTLSAALTTLFTRDFPLVGMVFILGCQGAGAGLVLQPTLVALQAHCSKAQRAVVISNRNFLRCTGGAVGLAASAALLQNRLKAELPSAYQYLASSTYSTPSFAGVPHAQREAILDAYATASRSVFIFYVPFIALCLIGCIVVKDRGLQRPEERAAQAAQNGAQTPQPDSKEPRSDINLTDYDGVSAMSIKEEATIVGKIT